MRNRIYRFPRGLGENIRLLLGFKHTNLSLQKRGNKDQTNLKLHTLCFSSSADRSCARKTSVELGTRSQAQVLPSRRTWGLDACVVQRALGPVGQPHRPSGSVTAAGALHKTNMLHITSYHICIMARSTAERLELPPEPTWHSKTSEFALKPWTVQDQCSQL